MNPDDLLLDRLVVPGPEAKTNLDDFATGLDLLPYLEAERATLFTVAWASDHDLQDPCRDSRPSLSRNR